MGAAGRIGAGLFLGPAGGAVAGRLATNWIDRGNPLQFTGGGNDPAIGGVQRESIAVDRGGFQGPNLGFPSNYGTVPSYQPNYSPTPATNPGTSWRSSDIGLTGGVFNGGAPNLGQNSTTASTARGFSGIGPIVPGFLGFGGANSLGSTGGANPFMRQSKFIR